MARWLSPGLIGGVFGTYVPTGGGGGGGGGGSGPTLPTLTTSGLTLQQRTFANTPTGQFYKDNALTQQAAAGDVVLGIKDISGAGHNFADIKAGQGSLTLTANQINGKNALVTGGETIIETRNASYLSTLRASQHVTVFFVGIIVAQTGAFSFPFITSRSTDVLGNGDPDSLIIRTGGGGSYITAGRMGAQGTSANGGYPLLTYSTDINAGWSDFMNKKVKIVLRACTGTSNTQRLDIAGTDGTNSGSHSTGYTNVAADADGGSAAWDYMGFGSGYYSGSVLANYTALSVLEIDVWTGSTQMSDADVASLMSYGTTQAGF